MDSEQADWARKQVQDIQERMGKRYSFSRTAVTQFANNLQMGEQVQFAEKVKFFFSKQPTFVLLTKRQWKKFSPGVLAVTDSAIHVLSTHEAKRYVLRPLVGYHLQHKSSDANEEVSLLLDRDCFLYFQIRRAYLDPLMATFKKFGIGEIHFQQKFSRSDGTVITWEDHQPKKIESAQEPISVSDSGEFQMVVGPQDAATITTSARIPDGPGSLRARFRKRYGRRFSYGVSKSGREPDVIQDIVRPWE